MLSFDSRESEQFAYRMDPEVSKTDFERFESSLIKKLNTLLASCFGKISAHIETSAHQFHIRVRGPNKIQ